MLKNLLVGLLPIVLLHSLLLDAHPEGEQSSNVTRLSVRTHTHKQLSFAKQLQTHTFKHTMYATVQRILWFQTTFMRCFCCCLVLLSLLFLNFSMLHTNTHTCIQKIASQNGIQVFRCRCSCCCRQQLGRVKNLSPCSCFYIHKYIHAHPLTFLERGTINLSWNPYACLLPS